MCSLFIF
jgi:hypothetical protein